MANPLILREIRSIATGASTQASTPTDDGSFVLPEQGRLTHVSVIAADVNTPPLWVAVVVDIENKGQFIVEGWVRGFGGVGGGGIEWSGSMPFSRKGTNWLAVFVRNDNGSTVSYVVQAVIE